MLYVHRSERADQLIAALADVLLRPLADPLAREVVAVPTRGVERWLTQRLSHQLGAVGGADGVCANVDFPFPGTLVGRATSVACGFDPDTDPWPPERSVWPLLGLVDELIDEPFMARLAAHLRAADPHPPEEGAGGPGLRRFATVRHLADLFDRYAVHRPDMVRAWADGRGGPGLHPDSDWQAELWRRLRDRIGVASPAERFEAAAGRLVAEPELFDCPERLSLFGLTRLPASHLQVLEAVGAARDVHLFLLHPSGALWARVDDAVPAPARALSRRDDPTAALPANPLLRSWGRDAREMQLVLSSYGVAGGVHRPVSEVPATLLGMIQDDIRRDRPPPGARPGPATGAAGPADARPVLRADDDSLRIHSCHGRARQVEVVRDAVLHLLARDPTLEPRDVIVMCPDIEAFAPLVHAAFGVGDPAAHSGDGGGGGDATAEQESGPPQLRVRLADRSIRQTNPLLAVAADLLELACGRVTASQVLDLAAREPVSRRFRFDEEELAQIERWVAGTGIRWGLDGAHRAPWSLAGVEANTWRAGIDRLLLGVTMGEDGQRLFGDTLPFDDVAGSGVDVAGRFAEMLARLQDGIDALTGPQPVERWAAALARATERLAVAAPDDAWQHDQLRRVLGEVVEEAGSSGRAGSAMLDRAEVRSLLSERLRGRPTRANFRTGDLTICTLVPMRSVPHRVVCLLGLDDGVFPRHTEQDGDDLLLADPRVGDRDARGEDRQLLLDALLAATEHLVVTFEGRDQRTNRERPPAVPVAELLDIVDRTVRLADPGRAAREAVLVQHPLQSFDRRNFTAGALGAGGPWSFDPVNLGGARALADGDRVPARRFLVERLAPLERPVIQLDSLVRFVEHPVKAFLRERLGLYVSDGPEPVADALPVELDALERWGVGDRILEARLAGAGPERAVLAERGRGLLPPGGLADAVLDEVSATVEALVAAVEALPCAGTDASSVEVNLHLPDGRSLVGTVPGVRDGVILRCVFSRLGPKHRLAAWVRLLALSVALPGTPVTAVTLGRAQGSSRSGPRVAGSAMALRGTDATRADTALAALGCLVDLYDRGMREPLPLYCSTSAAWAAGLRDGGDRAVEAARRQWRSEPDSPVPGEDSDPEHVLVLGPRRSFDDLRAEEPRDYEAPGAGAGAAAERGPVGGWPRGERSRFGGLARLLWDPLLDCEELA